MRLRLPTYFYHTETWIIAIDTEPMVIALLVNKYTMVALLYFDTMQSVSMFESEVRNLLSRPPAPRKKC